MIKSSKDCKDWEWHNQKPDIDNLQKFYLDTLPGILYDDDCYVTHTVNTKFKHTKAGVYVSVGPAIHEDLLKYIEETFKIKI